MAKINIQQLPKDKDFLKCFKSREGYKLIYTDIKALEPHVLAQFSKDPGLMSLYGPNAKPQDVYLWVAAQTTKWGAEVTKYYNPFDPTPESIALAKKHAKKARTEVKPVYLGWSYGLGAGTMHETTGIPIDECKIILADIDAAFPGVVKFNERLKEEWKENGGWIKQEWEQDPITGRNRPNFIDGRPGWIYNGRNRPVGVAPDKIKDLGNRFVQSTGHDVLLQFLMFVNKKRKGTSLRPYSVDLHDATIWEVKVEEVDKAIAVFKDSYAELNNSLRWDVKISGEILTGNTMADFLE